MVARWALPLLLSLLVAACAGPGVTVEKKTGFAPRPEQDIIYIVPFRTVMVPAGVAEPLFDGFVDELNRRGEKLGGDGYAFVILKEDLAQIDPEWLAAHYYVSGDVYGYVEDSGCCSTEMQISARLELFQPEMAEPTLTLHYPDGLYFDHDRASLVQKRRELAQRVAGKMAAGFWDALVTP